MDKKQVLELSRMYARSQGFKLNPDKKVVDTIINGLLANEEKYGHRYCPCKTRLIKDNICPCRNHKKEIKETGHCMCGLFVKR